MCWFIQSMDHCSIIDAHTTIFLVIFTIPDQFFLVKLLLSESSKNIQNLGVFVFKSHYIRLKSVKSTDKYPFVGRI